MGYRIQDEDANLEYFLILPYPDDSNADEMILLRFSISLAVNVSQGWS